MFERLSILVGSVNVLKLNQPFNHNLFQSDFDMLDSYLITNSTFKS